tara:strand:+ start:381 stop:857 length:477 start_codon:yes stop_codon:yes gene_type:complete
MPDSYVIEKIISGGQTGVDRAALDAALRLDIACGGWCPLGRWAEDGEITDHYPLQETESPDPAERTSQNVADSDGTLVLADEGLDDGSMLTVELAQKLGKSCLIFDFQGKGHVSDVRDWIVRDEIKILNVAGCRESTSPGIYELSIGFLTELFGSLKS